MIWSRYGITVTVTNTSRRGWWPRIRRYGTGVFRHRRVIDAEWCDHRVTVSWPAW